MLASVLPVLILTLYTECVKATTRWQCTPSGGRYDFNSRSYPGDFYQIRANQVASAIRAMNMSTNEPGTMQVGIRFQDTQCILTLMTFNKRKGEDFLVKAVSRSEALPEVLCGVIQTLNDPAYNEHPVVTLQSSNPSTLRFYNCQPTDMWLSQEKPVISQRNPRIT